MVSPPEARFMTGAASSIPRTPSSLFVGGKAPVRGSVGVSVEEGLLRSIAADAAGDTDNALHDKTLARASSAGLLFRLL